MSNLFSSFDPMVNMLGFNMSLNWLSSLIPILFLPQAYWMVSSHMSKTIQNIMDYLYSELSAVFGLFALPGTVFIFLSFFFFIFFCNLMGLTPYIFTSSSHMSFTLTLAMPIWIGSMVFSMKNQYNSLFAHLVPSGMPVALMPIMVIIETVSNIIRPGTLSIRLAANMMAGHLLLTFLGSQGPSSSGVVILGLMVSLILLLCLELAVACIQAYVFTILSSLYLNELSTVSFNKNMGSKIQPYPAVCIISTSYCAGTSVVHLVFLHKTGKSNPLGLNSKFDKILVYPYFSLKDLLGFFVMLFILVKILWLV